MNNDLRKAFAIPKELFITNVKTKKYIITIYCQRKKGKRTELTPKQAIELMRFTIISGEAMKLAMEEVGVSIGRINYQENGNWKPSLHIHLYCRAKSAKIQKFGDPIIPGHKESYTPLNPEDIHRIKSILSELFLQEKFSNQIWGL
jgi:diadenosine tetraphosphate (Ap4A) HIT family hydrolase